MPLITATIVVVLIYVLQKVIYAKTWSKGLGASCRFSRDYIDCGESAELRLVVENAKYLPLPIFQLKFSVEKSLEFEDMVNAAITDKYYKSEVFALMSNQRVTRKLSFIGAARGVVTISDMSMIVHDFLMSSAFAATIGDSDTIYVFPRKMVDMRFDMFFRGIVGNIETRRSLIEDRLTFRGIREYQPFDGMRSINWKQSAKSGELMVNVRGYSMDSEVKILVNLDTDSMIEVDRVFEETLSLASSFTRRILLSKMAVSLYVNALDRNGNIIHETGSGQDISHGITIDKVLTEVKTSRGSDIFIQKIESEIKSASENTHYLIISPYHKEDLMEKIELLKSAGAGVNMIVPFYHTYPYQPDADYISGWEVNLHAS